MTREEKAEIARRNGARSKGPTSEEGKAASRRNAIKHGRYASTSIDIAADRAVAHHEDRERFLKIVRRNLQQLRARTPLERDLAIALADTQWRFERWNLAETQLLNIEARGAVEALGERQEDGLDEDVTIEEAHARAARNFACRTDFLKRLTAERTRLMRERAQHLRTFRMMQFEYPKQTTKRTKEQTKERTNVLDFPTPLTC